MAPKNAKQTALLTLTLAGVMAKLSSSQGNCAIMHYVHAALFFAESFVLVLVERLMTFGHLHSHDHPPATFTKSGCRATGEVFTMDYAQLRARDSRARGLARCAENIGAHGLIFRFDKHSPHLERFLHLFRALAG
jgi:hypothetical protein